MTFPVRFLISNLLISILLGCILLSKRVLKKHLTLDAQYHLWYIFILALMVPLIPFRLFTPGMLYVTLKQLLSRAFGTAFSALPESTAPPETSPIQQIPDFAANIISTDTAVGSVLWTVWILGMILAAAFFIHTGVKIYFLRKNACIVNGQTEPELHQQFSRACKELRIRRRIRLYASCNLSSPVSYGWLRPTVIIPQDLDVLLSEEEVRFIFLHELQHYRHKDAFFNDLVCLLQILYWFNPLIWYGFRRFRCDREIACDHAVLLVIGQEQCTNYGYTLLRYAEHMQKGMFLSPLSTLGGSKDVIRQRILEIAGYRKDSAAQKFKSALVLLMALLLVFSTSPLLTAHAAVDSAFSLQGRNWSEIDVSSHFPDDNGAFVLYDMDSGHYQIYHRELSEQRVSPDSTFKIYSGLFALEEQLITPESSLLRWDGSEQPFVEWSRDQTLHTAMKNSVNWYFQNLDQQSGLLALSAFYQKISYGNCDLSGGIDSYWAESSLKISPVEQVMLLSDLLLNTWGFDQHNIEAVKDSLFLSDTALGRLYGKTGTGMVDGQNRNGWFVGFLERDGHTYCFATNIRNSQTATGESAARITTDILEELF